MSSTIDKILDILDQPTQRAGDYAYPEGSTQETECWRCGVRLRELGSERRESPVSPLGACARCVEDLRSERRPARSERPKIETRFDDDFIDASRFSPLEAFDPSPLHPDELRAHEGLPVPGHVYARFVDQDDTEMFPARWVPPCHRVGFPVYDDGRFTVTYFRVAECVAGRATYVQQG